MQIADYNHIKGSSKRPSAYLDFLNLVLTYKVCFSEPISRKDSGLTHSCF